MEMIPKVLQAVAGQGHLVYIYFHDGTVRLYDASPLLEKGGVFAPLRDDAIFRERLTVLNDTVAWDLDGNRNPAACIDLDPCELYESCPVVEAPPQRGDLTAALAYQKTSQHQTSTALFGTCGENWVTPALPRSRLCSPTSTPKPRAEGSSPSAPAKKVRYRFCGT